MDNIYGALLKESRDISLVLIQEITKNDHLRNDLYNSKRSTYKELNLKSSALRDSNYKIVYNLKLIGENFFRCLEMDSKLLSALVKTTK